MPDTRFFQNKGPFSLSALAALSGAAISDDSDSSLQINDVAPLDKANEGQITFLDNIKYKDALKSSKASVCVIRPDMVTYAPEGMVLLLSGSPYKAFALIAAHFYGASEKDGKINPKAMVSNTAQIGNNAIIDAGAIIEDGAEIGDNTQISAGAVIKKNVRIGSDCIIGSNAVISHSLIGNNVHIYAGACIGQDGFGFAMDKSGFTKVPQLGRVIIEDHVEIGANTTIDRGSMQDTIIGAGTWLDNMVQIAHNVHIGRNCVFVAQSGVSGSTTLGDFVVVAGQVGIAGHLNIGSGARIAAKSGVMRDIAAGEEHMGYPAMPIKKFMRQIATLNRMLKKDKS